MPEFVSLCSPFFTGRFIGFYPSTAHDQRHTLPPCASAHRLACRTIYQFQCLPDDLSVLYFRSVHLFPKCPKKAAEKPPLVLEERNDLFPLESAKILSVYPPSFVHFIPLGGLKNHFPPLLPFPCGGAFSHFSHATQSPPDWLVFGLFSHLGFSVVRLSIGCISARYAIAGFYLYFRIVHIIIFFRLYIPVFFVGC